MDGRQPWLWSRAAQGALWMAALLAGGLLLSPWWWHSWQSWQAAHAAHAALQAQRHTTSALRAQTEQLREAQPPPALSLTDVTAWTQLAQQQGLQVSPLAMDPPHAHTRLSGLQQLPVHVKVHGTWASWLNWLSQSATRTPGVTLAALELKADPRGGISAHLSAEFVQPSEQETAFALASTSAEPVSIDPFNPQHWAHTQHAHAAQHPSYTRWVAPELARPREPLESFPRERLRYVGHLTLGSEPEALVKVLPATGAKQDAAMLSVYRVRVGSHLGLHFGKVVRIAQDHVLLQEVVLMPSGEWQPREVRMSMQEDAP